MLVWPLLGVISAGRYGGDDLCRCNHRCIKMSYAIESASAKSNCIAFLKFSFMLISGLSVNYFFEGSLYDNLVVLFNAFLCVIAIYLFKYGIPLILNRSLVVEAYFIKPLMKR